MIKRKGFTLIELPVVRKRGFTLIELLVVIGIIAVLAAVVLVAVNPAGRLRDARNATRRSDVSNVLNAIKLHETDNTTLPGCLSPTTAVAATALNTCTDLGTALANYLGSLPNDPLAGAAQYTVAHPANSTMVTVNAPGAEGVTISVTR
ncbi:MAG: Uncharacterized protein CEN88_131 [Candidatus Berkelbacteria bacterium Licking1014_2]|uniref:General secretion pathway protein G n=1 Tax=Candidatus Berkelbacteria bacterium Licking1014_2 TaxID=2017146 RepID=A0A554LWG5_9BACT|nr:MAG: Uncharacterized protein CEN88_131 [Candidatus Berkelbacteria bacterium Licking1014_2]